MHGLQETRVYGYMLIKPDFILKKLKIIINEGKKKEKNYDNFKN